MPFLALFPATGHAVQGGTSAACLCGLARRQAGAGCAGAAAVAKELAMSDCLKGKSEVKKGAAKFQCRKCGARTDDKSHVCKPEKVKKKKK